MFSSASVAQARHVDTILIFMLLLTDAIQIWRAYIPNSAKAEDPHEFLARPNFSVRSWAPKKYLFCKCLSSVPYMASCYERWGG